MSIKQLLSRIFPDKKPPLATHHGDGGTTVEIECFCCKKGFRLEVGTQDYQEWENGKYAQEAFRYLTAPQRELLISQTCEECFNRMFPPEDDDDDEQ